MAYAAQADDLLTVLKELGSSVNQLAKTVKHVGSYAASQGGTAFIPDAYVKDGVTKTEMVDAYNSLTAIVTLLEANTYAHWGKINKIISPKG